MSRVTVSETVLSGPAPSLPGRHGTYFVAGVTDRGPASRAVVVRSVAEFEATFGPRGANRPLWLDLNLFFFEGGSQAVVCKAVGANAALASLTLNDVAPAAAVVLQAKAFAGSGAPVSATVTVSGGVATLTVAQGAVSEVYSGVSNASLVDQVASKSQLVTATVGAGTPGLVAAAVSANLTGEVAGDAPTLTQLRDAVDAAFPRALGPGLLAFPGVPVGSSGSDTAFATSVLNHCVDRDRLCAFHGPINQSTSDAQAARAAIAEANAAAASHGLYVWPHVTVPDDGGEITISPLGAVAAKRNQAHAQVGAWKAAFGQYGILGFALRPSQFLTDAQYRVLDDAGVTAIRDISGSPRVYGYRSLNTLVPVFRLVSVADLMNTIGSDGRDILERYVGETIDSKGVLYARIEGEFTGLLDSIKSAGGLFEVNGTPAYVVDATSVNTLAGLASGRIRVRVAVRPSPTAEYITLDLATAALDAAI